MTTLTTPLSTNNVSVEDFFTNSNWEGIVKAVISNLDVNNTAEIDHQEEEIPLDFSLFLTVEEFFTRHNWQGFSMDEGVFPKEVQEINNYVPSIWEMTVNEFFQRMVWNGKPNIAPMPEKVAATPNLSSSQELNVSDLSNLF